MIKLVSLLLENDLPAVHDQRTVTNTPQVDRVDADVENIRQSFAECLAIDPSEVQVKKSEKSSVEDYGKMSMTGDIIISCPKVKEMGATKVAELLNRFQFLGDIRINGCTKNNLSAIVFGSTRRHGGGGDMLSMMFGMSGLGDLAGGDVIVTSVETESKLLPYLGTMGINTANCEDAFEEYWSHIGGKVISDEEILRFQQQLAMSLRPRLGTRMSGALPGRRPALPGRRR